MVLQLSRAADSGRNTDTHRLRYLIAPPAMSAFVMKDTSETYELIQSTSKANRGFEHPATGLHLCPVSLDWYEKDENDSTL